MIQLHMLGALALRAADGHELRELLVQPKRLALLAYLAAWTPWRFHRRDKLLALFWPELDHGRARGALRQAVHVLRCALGEGVLVRRGCEELGLSAAHLWCDVAAFDCALDAGRLGEALALYRGDLLEGFFVASAPEFERWLEGERTRIRRRFATGAWSIAEAAAGSGDAATASHWARRAVDLSPDDEHSLRRLVVLLDRLGDRLGAVRVYDEFARRIAQAFELRPSPETVALVQSVRSRVRTRDLMTEPP
jgi:DNA-binding SARP family transcriptional activator